MKVSPVEGEGREAGQPVGAAVAAVEHLGEAFALNSGEVSGVVQTIYGYHIIKVEEKKEPGIRAEQDVQEKIGQFLYERKVRGAVQERINILRQKAEIEILLP